MNSVTLKSHVAEVPLLASRGKLYLTFRSISYFSLLQILQTNVKYLTAYEVEVRKGRNSGKSVHICLISINQRTIVTDSLLCC